MGEKVKIRVWGEYPGDEEEFVELDLDEVKTHEDAVELVEVWWGYDSDAIEALGLPRRGEMNLMEYQCIVADPPWLERGGGKIKRGADRHYPLLKTPDIIRVMLQSEAWRPAENAHLYLWVTNNFLADGFQVIEALGFRYITNIVWVKTKIGLGQYFRGKHEICLFAVRNRGTIPRSDDRSIESVLESWPPPGAFQAKTGRHSKKPDEFYDLVRRRTKGPRLEMFAREEREGFDVWGNEIEGGEEG